MRRVAALVITMGLAWFIVTETDEPPSGAAALALSRALRAAHETWRAGERRADRLDARMRDVLAMSPGVRPEYIAITDSATLTPVELVDSGTVIALAARVGSTRLIDNIILGEGLV